MITDNHHTDSSQHAYIRASVRENRHRATFAMLLIEDRRVAPKSLSNLLFLSNQRLTLVLTITLIHIYNLQHVE